MNIYSAIKEGSKILKKNNIKFSDLDCEILLAKVLKKQRKYLILNLDKPLNKKSLEIYKHLINQRSSGKPIAYLIKKKDFWNSEFITEEGVLIPRPDTEVLIEATIELFKNKDYANVLDIGVGTGCIILSILEEKPCFYGIGIDVSSKSISLSKLNAKKLHLENRVKFIKTDVDNFCHGKYDLVVSNPPYINSNKIRYLEKDIKNFEPKLALDGGLDGTFKILKIIEKASTLLKCNGKLILEIGYDQKNKIVSLLKKRGFYINNIIKDYAKNNRCVISTKII
jgi:release factor glutamine methyltransferase